MPGLEQGAWAGRAGIGAWQGGQRADSSPSCPPHVSFISPLRAHLHPRCGLAGRGTGVPAALAAQWWAAGAMPSLPVSARTGPVPCHDPALCCCLHGPQLSKPRCQMPWAMSFLPGAGTGRGAACVGRTADTEGGQQFYSWLSARGSIPSQVGTAGPQGLVGMQGWPGGAGCPPYPLCPGQPCPSEKSEMGGFLLAMSQCPRHVPSSGAP